MDPVEKREFPRLVFDVDIAYQVVAATGVLGEFNTHSKDISAGGIRLVTLEKLPVNTILDLTFKLPGQAEPVCTLGKVAWIDRFSVGTTDSSLAYDAGIQFIAVSPEDKEKISQYILSRTAQGAR